MLTLLTKTKSSCTVYMGKNLLVLEKNDYMFVYLFIPKKSKRKEGNFKIEILRAKIYPSLILVGVKLTFRHF